MNEQILYNRPAFPAQLNMSHPLTRGLVGCWVMNDNGMRAFDSSPYGNHGTVINAKGNYSGRTFSAVAGERVDCGTVEKLRLSDNFILEAWIMSTDVTVDKTIISRRQGGNNWQFNLGSITAGKLYFSGWVATAESFNLQSNMVLASNKIYQVIYYHSPAGIGYVINGVKDATGAYPGALDVTVGTSFLIGTVLAGAASWLGNIMMVRAYNKVLPISECQKLYLNPYDMFLK